MTIFLYTITNINNYAKKFVVKMDKIAIFATVNIMDGKDREIIRILQENARTPFTEIAKRLKVSESTIRNRVSALERDGVIKKYTIVVDPVKMGLNTVAIVGLDVEPSMFLEAAKKMVEIEKVRYVATSTGDHMIMSEIWTKDGKELSVLISEKIGKIKGVHRICPAIILEKLKES
ncbi:MAG: HTH-type transcriptional regulator Ptr2 [Candidatus Methanolliviera sp. GoM_oil]|nr:MAG: HTH-type transcriptional regulator Ptr2 [Candidatus Methanolliviera sp. GoM_oil]